jgi:hypothetical protein
VGVSLQPAARSAAATREGARMERAFMRASVPTSTTRNHRTRREARRPKCLMDSWGISRTRCGGRGYRAAGAAQAGGAWPGHPVIRAEHGGVPRGRMTGRRSRAGNRFGNSDRVGGPLLGRQAHRLPRPELDPDPVLRGDGLRVGEAPLERDVRQGDGTEVEPDPVPEASDPLVEGPDRLRIDDPVLRQPGSRFWKSFTTCVVSSP